MPEIPAEADADALFQVITVHCFFHCGHAEHGTTPQSAHDGMEQHYSEKHAAEIRSILRKHTYKETHAAGAQQKPKSRKRKVS